MINACANLIASKPDGSPVLRTTCVVCLSDMFTSEIRFWFSEIYLQQVTGDENGESRRIISKPLADETGLILAVGFQEMGVTEAIKIDEDPQNHFLGNDAIMTGCFRKILPRYLNFFVKVREKRSSFHCHY